MKPSSTQFYRQPGCFITPDSANPMSPLLILPTNSLQGLCGKSHPMLPMAMAPKPTLNIGLITPKPLLKPKFFPVQNTHSITNHEKIFDSLVEKKFTNSVHRGPPRCMSIEVGKEENSSTDGSANLSTQSGEAEAAPDPRRGLEERFVVLNTGKYECSSCGYVYDQALGDPAYPIAPGLEFFKLPEDWRCPTCGAAKTYFNSKSIEIAGFAQNQQFGLGGNTLTSGQKSILIYGSLLFAFILFLMGYFIQ